MNLNHIRIRPLSRAKQRLAPHGRHTYRVPFGLLNDLRLQLDLQNEMQIYLGLWERETYRRIRSVAQDCAWFVDVGAGKGELCLFFIKNSPASRIIAVEPQTSETDIMSTDLRLNNEHGNPKLTVLNCFVGSAAAPDFTSLDSLNLDPTLPGFIKIDVDGLEMDVLRSGECTISNGRPTLLVETHSKALEDECIDWLTRRGYLVKIIANAWWRFAVPEQRPTAHNRWLWAEKRSQDP